MSSHEVQANTWANFLQNLVVPSIEQMLIIVKSTSDEFCRGNPSQSIDYVYRHGLASVLNARDDQLTAKIEKDSEVIRNVLHSFVKSHAAMIAHNTDTVCTQPIVIPRVSDWYRRVVTDVFYQLSYPGMVQVHDMSQRRALYAWIEGVVRRQAEKIVPISAFSPKQAEKKRKRVSFSRTEEEPDEQEQGEDDEEKGEDEEPEEEVKQERKKPVVIQVEKESLPDESILPVTIPTPPQQIPEAPAPAPSTETPVPAVVSISTAPVIAPDTPATSSFSF